MYCTIRTVPNLQYVDKKPFRFVHKISIKAAYDSPRVGSSLPLNPGRVYKKQVSAFALPFFYASILNRKSKKKTEAIYSRQSHNMCRRAEAPNDTSVSVPPIVKEEYNKPQKKKDEAESAPRNRKDKKN